MSSFPQIVFLIEPSFCSDTMTIPYKWFFSQITMQCMLPKGTHIYLELYKKVTGRQKTHLHLWTLVCVSLSHWPKGGIVQQFFLWNSGIEKKSWKLNIFLIQLVAKLDLNWYENMYGVYLYHLVYFHIFSYGSIDILLRSAGQNWVSHIYKIWKILNSETTGPQRFWIRDYICPHSPTLTFFNPPPSTTQGLYHLY